MHTLASFVLAAALVGAPASLAPAVAPEHTPTQAAATCDLPCCDQCPGCCDTMTDCAVAQ